MKTQNIEQMEAHRAAVQGLQYRWIDCTCCDEGWLATFTPGTDIFAIPCPMCKSKSTLPVEVKYGV